MGYLRRKTAFARAIIAYPFRLCKVFFQKFFAYRNRDVCALVHSGASEPAPYGLPPSNLCLRQKPPFSAGKRDAFSVYTRFGFPCYPLHLSLDFLLRTGGASEPAPYGTGIPPYPLARAAFGCLCSAYNQACRCTVVRPLDCDPRPITRLTSGI